MLKSVIRTPVLWSLLLVLTGCVGVHETGSVADWGGPAVSTNNSRPASSQDGTGAGVVSALGDAWVPLSRWCSEHSIAPPNRLVSGTNVNFVVMTRGGALTLAPWSRIARWQGMEIHLGSPPQVSNGDLLVRALDLEKTVHPLLVRWNEPLRLRNRIVVLDPGHGGEDTGARNLAGNICEKDLTLDWARRLAPLLENAGWQVVLTRNHDVTLALSNRVAMAEAVDAALFLSLHFNSGPAETGAGLETYCLTPAGMKSNLVRGNDDEIGAVHRNNGFDAANLLLACRVHGELLRVSGVKDRGVRRARFMGVLKGQNRPAILIEGGYLSHSSDLRLITTGTHRQRLAQAVATGLAEGFGVGSLAAADIHAEEPNRTNKGTR